MGEYLQLSPPELKFRFELRKNIPVTLSLHNPGTERVAFKVELTALNLLLSLRRRQRSPMWQSWLWSWV